MVNQRSNIEWDSYKAVEYAEGFGDGEEATTEQQLEAWAYIISNKLYKRLQGWFGRVASGLIESELISEDGVINWERIDDLIYE